MEAHQDGLLAVSAWPEEACCYAWPSPGLEVSLGASMSEGATAIMGQLEREPSAAR